MQVQLSSLRSLLYKTMPGGIPKVCFSQQNTLYKAVFKASHTSELMQAISAFYRKHAVRAGTGLTLAHLEMGKDSLNVSSREKEAIVPFRDPFYF